MPQQPKSSAGRPRKTKRKSSPRERISKITTQKILATVIVVAWLIIQFFLLTHEIFDSMREIVMRTLGTLDMILGTVIHYFFNVRDEDTRPTQPEAVPIPPPTVQVI